MAGKTVTEAELPTPEEARAAFEQALDERQERVRTALKRLAAQPPQVLVLEGGLTGERFSVALWHAALLNCEAAGQRPCLTCPACLQVGAGIFQDLFVLDGREGSIKIEAVRELRGILGEPPRGNGKRVVILAEAQALGVEAANALLKSMEEPRPGVCFLLLAPQRERLLPTLVSRGWTLTLAWPDVAAPSPPDILRWEEDLARFLRNGQGWFARTSGKGAVDAALARSVVMAARKAQASVLAGRDGGPLAECFRPLTDARRQFVSDLLSQSQESLDATVNPALVLDWLATHLYQACRQGNRRSG